METEGFKKILFAYADAVRFLFTTKPGIFAVFILAVGFFLFRVWSAARARALACEAADAKMSVGEALAILGKELYDMVLGVVAGLPAVVAVVAISGTVFAVSDSLKSIDEMRLNAARISELSTVVRNLEKRQKVADVLITSVDGEATDMRLSYFDASSAEKSVSEQSVSVAGTDIYFDAIVCNFDYAEIASGRKVNLAIPYRVFSDKTAQENGVVLGVRDSKGIPYMYIREAGNIYGIAPEAFNSRLSELIAILNDDGRARREGIVRSVYGSAVHRRVKAGDRFSIWVEQSGGIVIKNAREF